MLVNIQGTLPELFQLWEPKVVCEMLHIDYYKVSLVSDDEQFTITTDDLVRVGLFKTE